MLLLIKKIKFVKVLLLTAILLTSINAKQPVLSKNKQNMFVGVSAGYNNLNSDEVTSINLNSSGYNYIVELGYITSVYTEITLNYQKILNDDLSLDNYYITGNYKFLNETNFTPYLGFSVGYSELSWKKTPVNSNKNDFLSSSYIGGFNFGVMYKINNDLSLTISYQLQYMNDHKTSINTSTQVNELTHDLSNSFNIGARYFWKTVK